MSFPRYPKYKPSGVEWLGDMPAHWEIRRIGQVATKIGSGKTPSGGAEGYVSSGVLFLRSQNVLMGSLDCSDVVFIPEEVDAIMSSSRVMLHDILLNITGASLGRSAFVCQDLGAANVNQHVCIVRIPGVEQARFTAWFLQSTHMATQFESVQNGAAREGLNYFQISKMIVTVPPLPEQRAIAAFLDRETAKIDGLVDEQRRLIELLKEKRQAVISHAVTKGLDPKAPMKPSGVEWLGDVPAHWEVRRIAALFAAVAESGAPDLPILSVSIHDGVSDKEMSEDEMERKVTRSEDRSKYVRVAPGDLVYNMMRAWQGAFGTVTTEGMVSPAYVVARPRTSCETRFIELLLRTPQAIEQMRRFSKGITDFRMRLYWDEFKNLVLPVPPAREVAEVLSRIGVMEEQFSALERESESAITLLQERRSALISAAVTGQIDVRNAATTEAA